MRPITQNLISNNEFAGKLSRLKTRVEEPSAMALDPLLTSEE
jgi:hypothetical protein